MKPEILFSALAEIAAEHERSGPSDGLNVIPVLSDELETRRDLLNEVAELLGGSLLDASGENYVADRRAVLNPILQGVLEEGLDFEIAAGNRAKVSLEFAGDGDPVVGQLETRGQQAEHPTPAQAQLIDVARTLFDERLSQDELALLLYDETIFDERSLEAVLTTLTGLGRTPGVAVGSIRTLVLLIKSAGINRSLHCQLNRGVRYSLQGEEIIRRNRSSHLYDSIQKIIVDRPQPLVLFLGAGFSASSDMPVGNGVRNSTIRRLCDLPDIFDGRTDEDLATELFRFGDAPERDLLSPLEKDEGIGEFARNATLEQAVRIERDFLEVEIPPTIDLLREHHNSRVEDAAFKFGNAVYALQRMFKVDKRLILVSVNFDELVEQDHDDWLDVAVEDEQFADLAPILSGMKEGAAHPDGKVPYLKLHGTINKPATVVATDDTTRSGITPGKAQALRAMVEDLPEGQRLPWVYIGASMRDIDLNRVFGAYEFANSVSERWVAPWLEPTVRRFVFQNHRWWMKQGKTLQERVVTETADSFMLALADAWAAG